MSLSESEELIFRLRDTVKQYIASLDPGDHTQRFELAHLFDQLLSAHFYRKYSGDFMSFNREEMRGYVYPGPDQGMYLWNKMLWNNFDKMTDAAIADYVISRLDQICALGMEEFKDVK